MSGKGDGTHSARENDKGVRHRRHRRRRRLRWRRHRIVGARADSFFWSRIRTRSVRWEEANCEACINPLQLTNFFGFDVALTAIDNDGDDGE